MQSEPSPLQEIREKLALAVGENAVFDGWTPTAVDAAAGQIGIDPAQARLAMPYDLANRRDIRCQDGAFTRQRIQQGPGQDERHGQIKMQVAQRPEIHQCCTRDHA